MTVINVPRPKGVMDPNREASSLLLAQVQHLHEAQKRLPPRYQSKICINAIKTEGEAGEYIREVTEAIHRAHDDAEKLRTKRLKTRDRTVLSIAPAAPGASRKKRLVGKKASVNKSRKK